MGWYVAKRAMIIGGTSGIGPVDAHSGSAAGLEH